MKFQALYMRLHTESSKRATKAVLLNNIQVSLCSLSTGHSVLMSKTRDCMEHLLKLEIIMNTIG